MREERDETANVLASATKDPFLTQFFGYQLLQDTFQTILFLGFDDESMEDCGEDTEGSVAGKREVILTKACIFFNNYVQLYSLVFSLSK